MLITESAGIIADDLTGANETALQFFMKGCNTKILTNTNQLPESLNNTEIWAISTESKNTAPDEAYRKTYKATKFLTENLKAENLYKKIDSTMRGNVAAEIKAILDATDYEAAVIMPAYPNEGRVTIGGYNIHKGIPIERTELARDPKYPIYESHVPTILKFGLDEKYKDSVDLIDFNTVKQGAGPILVRLNDLINKGKKLIVVDSVSSVDIEQVILAIKKCPKKILACGSSGATKGICELLFPGKKYEKEKFELKELPKLVISGSSSQITSNQIKNLENDEDAGNTYFIEVTPEQILNSDKNEIIEKSVKNLVRQNTVVIHTSSLFKDPDAITIMLFEKEISREAFIDMICNFLADVTKTIMEQKELILITIGGETAYKCMEKLDINNIDIIDAVSPVIPLCRDNKERFIVTKSGNQGSASTLTEVIKYFDYGKN